VKAAKLALLLPSLTLIAMFEYVPTCALLGVPASRPVQGSKLAQEGRFAIVKYSGSAFESFAVGAKL
jgi:hypothetical protein